MTDDELKNKLSEMRHEILAIQAELDGLRITPVLIVNRTPLNDASGKLTTLSTNFSELDVLIDENIVILFL